MKTSHILLSLGLALGSLATSAQNDMNVVQRAMYDELHRNLKELKSENYQAPFFINYTLQDQTSWSVAATLGALTHSYKGRNRDALSVRLLVGDYEFNDESLDNNLFSAPRENDLSYPLDDDYLGIRRALWVSTDNVYINASRQFQKNQEMLKEEGKPLSEVPHRSFLKVAPVKINIPSNFTPVDMARMEDYVRTLSAVFKEFPQIENSSVAFMLTQGTRYIINSEGTSVKMPVSRGVLRVSAALKTENGEFAFDQLSRLLTSANVPATEEMIKAIRELASGIIASVEVPKLMEEYEGPVLLLDRVVAEVVRQQLFASEGRLIASNNIPSLKGYRFENNSSIDAKIGKSVFSDLLTIKALPKLRQFGTVELLGAFEVDDEGVVPADETVLVENGLLKEMMNDRTAVKPNQTPNGLALQPGVISVESRSSIPYSQLKAKLIETAKKQGLEHAYIVGSLGDSGGGEFRNVIQVTVADGSEKTFKQAVVRELSNRNFKKILATSTERAAYNLGDEGDVLSVICPRGIILEEVELSPAGFPTLKEEDYVPSTLKK